MGGGIMQLIAYGAQDIYLTGNPQITFFKVVYRRHTNFSMETIKQNISGQSFIGIDNVNNKATVTISRNGDLVTGVYVLAKQTDTTNSVGICADNLVEDVEIEIGGQRIDKHFKEWNQVWNELTTPISKSEGYKYMTSSFSNKLVTSKGTKQTMVHYPLNFWFCRNPGLALPLISLQHHEVQLKFTWGVGKYDTTNDQNLTRSNKDITGVHLGLKEQHTVEVWVDYIYLDTDERRRFSQVSHEYLIEQLQIQKEKDVSGESFKLNLEHPIKVLIWTTPKDYPLTDQKIKISINGHDRFYERYKEFFALEQPYKYHTSIPGYNIKETENPVLLTNSIFSKEYTFNTNQDTSNGTIISNSPTDITSIDRDNEFIINKTYANNTNTSSAYSDQDNTFLFTSNGNTDMDFKVGDVVRVNYYNISDIERSVNSAGGMNTALVQQDYGGGFGGSDRDPLDLRIEMIPIQEVDGTVGQTNTNLINGNWRTREYRRTTTAEVIVVAGEGAAGQKILYLTSESGVDIRANFKNSDDDEVHGDEAPPALQANERIKVTGDGIASNTTVDDVVLQGDAPNVNPGTYKVTLTNDIVTDLVHEAVLNFEFIQNTSDSELWDPEVANRIEGVQHDNLKRTHQDIVPAPSRPRPATYHTKVNTYDVANAVNDDPKDKSKHMELNSSFVKQLGIVGNYKDKSIENIVRNLTVLEVFKSKDTLISGKTIYEIRFNDNMGIIPGNINVSLRPTLNHKVSFEIIARVQNPVSRCSQLKKDIYVYSFCLEPEEHQPSGSCNFSRIDNARLLFSSPAYVSNIYAVNYNVLRIMSGMGGLAYSS